MTNVAAGTQTAAATHIDEVKKRVEIFTSLVTSVGLLIGGGFALVQYWQKNHDDRIRETLNFLTKLSQPDIWNQRANLNKAFERHQTDFEVAVKGGEVEYNKWLIDLVKTNDLEGNVMAVGEIYDQLAICVAAELCDKPTALRFFLVDAQSFYHGLYPYIEKRRKETNDPTILENLASFSSEKQPRVFERIVRPPSK